MDDATRQSHAAPRRPGRPRSVRAERAILDAALTSLVEAGYAGTSIEGIAARAGVGKTTIYRRWSSKDDLLAAALRTLNENLRVPDTGDLRTDLRLLMEQLAHNTTSSVIWPAFNRAIGASLEAPELMAILQENVILPRRAALLAVLQRAHARRELRPEVEPELLAQVIGGAFLIGIIFGSTPALLDPTQRDRLLDLLLYGALAKG